MEPYMPGRGPPLFSPPRRSPLCFHRSFLPPTSCRLSNRDPAKLRDPSRAAQSPLGCPIVRSGLKLGGQPEAVEGPGKQKAGHLSDSCAAQRQNIDAMRHEAALSFIEDVFA